MRFSYRASGAVVSLALAVSAAAQTTNQWYLRGPESGYVQRVAIDKVSGKPLAGGDSGMFVYSGGHWQFANAGAPTPYIADIAISAGATFINSGGYVSRSTDGGATWLNVSSTLMNGAVTTVATSAANASRVYAAVNPTDGSAYGGVWISNDLGNAWTQSAASAGANLALVRVSPTNANLIFVASQSDPITGISKLFRSADGGMSFQGPIATTSGDPNTIGLIQFFDLAQDPFDANHMIAVAGGTDGIYKAVYGELWTSSDAGQTWSVTTPAFQIPPDAGDQGEPRAVLFDRYTQGTVYYATTLGVFKSTTGGNSPVLSSTGLIRLGTNNAGVQPYDEVTHLTQDSDASHTLYAASVSDGVYVSTDAAANWSSINTGYTGLDFRTIAFQPGGTNLVLAGASDPSISNGVYRSTDGGTTWTRSATGMNANVLRGLAFAPAPNSNVVLAAGYKPQQTVGGEFNRGFWRSTDSGQTWTAINDPNMPRNSGKRIIQFDPNDANRVLLATAGAGVALSTDGGVTWINSSAQTASFFGLPTQVANSTAGLLGLAAGPAPSGSASPTRFYAGFTSDPNPPAGAAGGVYYSDDGGYHWTASNPLPHDANAFYFSVSPTPGTVYMIRADYPSIGSIGGAFKSTNYGVDWQDVTDATLPTNLIAVAADPIDPNVVWASAWYSDIAHQGGVFRSNDGGTTWVPYGRGLRIPAILWMSIDPADHNHLLAGGYEGIHEMHFAPDADQDGIPDSEESLFAGGDANGDGTQDSMQANVASVGTDSATTAPIHAKAPAAPGDYVVVEIDKSAPYSGTCNFVSDLQVISTDLVPLSNRMVQVAPTIRFSLPDCTAAHVKIRYSVLSSYAAPAVFGSYSPTVPGDATTMRWGVFDPALVGVDGSGVWTIPLADNAYGNVYAPGSGSLLFQGAPGRDSIFADGFGD